MYDLYSKVKAKYRKLIENKKKQLEEFVNYRLLPISNSFNT